VSGRSGTPTRGRRPGPPLAGGRAQADFADDPDVAEDPLDPDDPEPLEDELLDEEPESDELAAFSPEPLSPEPFDSPDDDSDFSDEEDVDDVAPARASLR
jgi:hypothetical protein